MRLKFSLVAPMLLLAACAEHHPQRQQVPEFHPARSILEAYDVNHDGTITRAELEQGVRAEFARADAKHTGCLDEEEVRAVNEQRWNADQSTATPLVDFKGKGCIDFDAFAAAPRSLFEQMDRDGDGKVTPKELQPFQRRPDNN
jgi:Ca2+-binding EF-hand superfamily protein